MKESNYGGDLGNIQTTDFGETSYTQVNTISNILTLEKGKKNSIIGLAIVITMGGNSNARLTCGIVESLNK